MRSGGVTESRADRPARPPRAAAADPPGALVGTWALAIGALALARLVGAGRADRAPARQPGRGGARCSSSGSRSGACGRATSPGRTTAPPSSAAAGPRGLGAAWRGAPWQGLLACLVGLPALPGRLLALRRGAAAPARAGWRRCWRPTSARPARPSGCPTGCRCLAAVQLLVVALPEELFYRGWMQTSWARRRPGARRHRAGGAARARLPPDPAPLRGRPPRHPAALAPGHLLPRACSSAGCGSAPAALAAPVVAHALSNLFIATLERSFYG